MGIYNTKAEYDYNTLVKKRNSKNYKTRSASAQYNILNSFRDRNYVDLKSIVYQTLFPKPKRITNNNSPAQHEEVITIREFQNYFTYSASLFEKEYRVPIKQDYIERAIDSILLYNDYFDRYYL